MYGLEELGKQEYCDCRWQKNEDNCTVWGIHREKFECQEICEVWFCRRSRKEKEHYDE